MQRTASHIQVFALSRWLAVTLPVEYYELTRGLQWSIPYFNLPWEKENIQSVMVGSNSPTDRLFRAPKAHDSTFFQGLRPEAANVDPRTKVYGLPLNPMEYASYFEVRHNYFYSKLGNHFCVLIGDVFLYRARLRCLRLSTSLIHKIHMGNFLIKFDFLVPERSFSNQIASSRWRDFSRSMFWLAIIGGSLILLHVILVMILKFRKQNKEKQSYGALIFPRFEIFLLVLALPCICEASAALIKGTKARFFR